MDPLDRRWNVHWKPEMVSEQPTSPTLRAFARLAADGITAAPGWWSDMAMPEFGEHYGTNPGQWIGLALFRRAIEGGPAVHIASWEGNLVVPAKQFVESVEKAFGVRVVRVQHGLPGNGTFTYSSTDTMFQVSFRSGGKIGEVHLATCDESVLHKAAQLFDRCLVQDDPERGFVFALVKTPHGYSINRVGTAGNPVERGNYAPSVLADYDHIVDELSTDSPCGRLIILSGEPGTGKTYLVRSLLSAATRTAFVIVPPHLVAELSGPELLPALTSAKSDFDGPVVLVIEDADRCLVDRKNGNMDAISTMLNMGDGILGSMLDIRILATTNAETIEMDAATRRPGRLCRHVEVGPLPAETANAAVRRLAGNAATSVRFERPTTLAEVYAKARSLGWKPPKVQKGPAIRTEIL